MRAAVAIRLGFAPAFADILLQVGMVFAGVKFTIRLLLIRLAHTI